MSETQVDNSKRTWLIASGCAGAVGTIFTAVPFVESFEPSERARAAGAPVEVDISGLKAGDKMTVAWRGQPVWVIRRTAEELAQLPKNDPELADPKSQRPGFTPPWAQSDWRSIKPEYLVIVGICTHLGCTPDDRFTPGPQPSLPSDWPGGFLCPCHGSTYDMSGRVFKNKPAPDNMLVPPYTFLSDTRLLIGEHDEAKKA